MLGLEIVFQTVYVRASMWVFARITQVGIRSLLDIIIFVHPTNPDGHRNTNIFGWQDGTCRLRAVDSITGRYFALEFIKEEVLHPYRSATHTLKMSDPLLSEMFRLRVLAMICEMQTADEYVLAYDLFSMNSMLYNSDMITRSRFLDAFFCASGPNVFFSQKDPPPRFV
ncbi:hypothetical protein X801_04689 [Opisthorchis viverrini]|uniref:Uncharacterized protein n=1 Tax=Opisthorchis viverrini TaxID=6198 RepID=A0A1S8WYE8_OPIVI|nr:hypothetical protein X801_04689 [Opisthorchis viverrini]